MTGRERHRPDRVYRVVIAAFRLLFRAFGLRFDVRGADRIPANGPAVIACNHVGYLDFTFVGLAALGSGRFVRFMAKHGTFDNPVSGPLMRAMHHIPVDRDDVLAGAVAYRRAIRELEQGEIVGVFPESTISRSWRLRPFMPGAAALAVRQQVPLVPVVTWGGHRLATVDGHVALRRRVPVSVHVGEPIAPDRTRTRTDVEALLRERLTDLLDAAQDRYPDVEPGAWWLPAARGGCAPTPEQAADKERQVERDRRAKRERSLSR